MRLALKLHPDSHCAAVRAIDVDVARMSSDLFALRYLVTGTIADLALAPATASERADNLWQHTCFEAFLCGQGEAYAEFNFSPSTQWAAYRFSGYRAGMSDSDIAPPDIDVLANADSYELRVTVEMPDDATGRFALSAVIEEKNGAKSYWALAHPPGKPDFHHAESFAYDLPEAEPL